MLAPATARLAGEEAQRELAERLERLPEEGPRNR